MRLRYASIPALISAALLLGACGSSEEPDTTSDDGGAAENTDGGASEAPAGPVTVTDSRGEEITLDAPAQKVVALEWMETESLVDLGVMPVGVADVEGYTTWVGGAAPLDDTVTDVGTRQEPSVESIVALEPDLIITEDRGNNLVAQLEKQTPVIVIKGADTATGNIEQMRNNLTTIATAVGKDAEAEQLLADFDAAIADGKQKIADAGLAGDKFAMADGWLEGSSVAIRMFAKGSLVSDLGEALGLENAWPEKGDAEWGLGQTDVEGLTKLPDLHFFYSASGPEDVFADNLGDNAIWQGLPFVENEQVYKLESGTWTFGGPASCEYIIEQFVTLLTA